MVACRDVSGNEPTNKELLYTEFRMGANWFENFLKDSVGYPSGPGDFPHCILLMAFSISPTENGDSNLAAFAGSV